MRGISFLFLLFFSLQSAVCHKEARVSEKQLPVKQDAPATDVTTDSWTVPPPPPGTEDQIFCIMPVEKEAVPRPDWKKYLADKLVLDTLSADSIPPGKYQVIVQFVVEKDGHLSDVRIAQDPGFGLGAHTARVVAAYDEQWIPGERNGRPIRCFRKQPITFVIEEDDCEDALPANVIL